jgi:hypothetical protein
MTPACFVVLGVKLTGLGLQFFVESGCISITTSEESLQGTPPFAILSPYVASISTSPRLQDRDQQRNRYAEHAAACMML